YVVKDCDSLCGDGSYLLAVTKRTTSEALVLWRGGHMHTSQPYEKSSATLPKVPMNFSEADERFACKDCFMQRGDNNFVCLLCDMEFWGEADLRFHSTTRRHQKASRNKVWENIETFIQMRYGDSLSLLGVVQTSAGTLRCVHCEKPLPSYYDAARHVNTRAHDDYMKHAFWHCEALAIHDGTGWRRSEAAQHLLRDMPDPCRLMREQYIAPTRDSCFVCKLCGTRLDCLARIQEHIASNKHTKKRRWMRYEMKRE
ncbi:hypothetical protein FOZ63_028809, partial [Perkinsus olseni]